jgi:hypothetical protein
MVSVRVCWKSSGRPAAGHRVVVGFDGWSRGMSSEAYTDSNGDVHFDNDPGRGTVYVNGSAVHQGHLSGRVVVYA